MPKTGPSLAELTERFHDCLKGTGGAGYGETVRRYAERNSLNPRTAKVHLKRLCDGIERGEVDDLAFYRRGRTRVIGNTDDKVFMDQKEETEREPKSDRYPAYIHLGGLYQDSPVRSEWTTCPVANRIVRTTVITMGVADFMECPTCNRAHFLGVNPRMKDRRLYAWQIDPLVNASEYADAITTQFMGDPKTSRPQKSSIERIRQGGHYIGLWFRSSWDEDPMENLRKQRLLKPMRRPRHPGKRTLGATEKRAA
jgi:hypothetical protein